ncbi:glucosyltransferase domain-containing protein [Proteus faecis]|uniref:Glucosyltransferase domain-containing protein n=1 Tax=Proteus faecis TaxID=2050967 RepID=A0AAW7CPD3_9GAMM|nr:glucosyltransferase domain-containing protein [Proteus faecis]MDL5165831.1 glucosyltransferase domain-containing protein [Proteus faecis]MDL5273905.1 glucosyltransferase domain-containing protein [Proteus faecis]MDL5277475.1 glucosyltransferase domain-containing protein [Proteus faecis]MDL5306464.1 glucosyltransferase domain-containing protein [Proteus faecis]MDL5313516.1 glucosyltransferase domain-containing protein [Proteus faecis]
MLNNYIIKEKKAVFICLTICLLLIIPIILSGSIYIDDNTRVIRHFNWTGDGRFLANYFFEILSLGNGVLDYYPWTNILSSLIIGFSSIIIAYSLNIKGTTNIILICSGMMSSPFILSNLSYRFDSIIMAISFTVAIIPFIFYSNIKKFFIVSYCCLLISSYLYQPSVSAFVCMAIVYSTYLMNSIKCILKTLSLSAIVFSLSIITFFIINNINGGVDRSELFFHSDNPIGILEYNLNRSAQLIFWSSNGITKIIYLIASIAFISSCIKTAIKSLSFVFIYIFSLFSIIILSFILNSVLLSPWFTSRTMICFPFVVTYCFLLFIKNFNLSIKLKNIFSTITVFCSLIFCSIYANALSSQDSLNRVYFSKIMSKVDGDIKKLAVYGEQPRPREFVRANSVYPLLDNIVPNYMKRGSGWAQVYLHRNSSRFRMITMQEQEQIFKESCGNGVWNNGELFDYKVFKNVLIISFSGQFCK